VVGETVNRNMRGHQQALLISKLHSVLWWRVLCD